MIKIPKGYELAANEYNPDTDRMYELDLSHAEGVAFGGDFSENEIRLALMARYWIYRAIKAERALAESRTDK